MPRLSTPDGRPVPGRTKPRPTARPRLRALGADAVETLPGIEENVRMRLPQGLEGHASGRPAAPVTPEVVPRASPPGGP